ncbi:hypothetical protein WICMUC_004530 [Wickerhamomyces mucosus]|uniref:Uncharacterized protein n=1 Tax=Wickerhamomyces mucosus TaxID=1378264 RepID=A0A9P8PHD2_9ASCO|nr:hypothetical protein WICMUC_004530 [Wickerhamomyces mucosus]
MDLDDNLGGVPVFNLPNLKPASFKVLDIPNVAFSPILPAGYAFNPIWISPPRKVPVVMTTFDVLNILPSSKIIPLMIDD